ncbi:MAG: ketoacyl-ACP synthase III [Isosphaeraceae bacterium]|nr:ketoacyl-ACP synthase III [Isosphaeraceae bacterium]
MEESRPDVARDRSSRLPHARFRPSTTSVKFAGLSAVATALGSDEFTNEALTARFPGKNADAIRQRTGIESRRRLAPDESVLTLGVEAARRLLRDEGLTLDDVDALICCTTTPLTIMPSTACLILYELDPDREMPAYDIYAACTGYLYALAAAFDYTLAHPQARVLVVTTETISRVIDPDDFGTAILFGDAASASLVTGAESDAAPRFRMRRPLISAKGEPGRLLRLSARDSAPLAMDGLLVYCEAVPRMIAMLRRACDDAGVTLDDLRWVVPHQANGRIVQDVRKKLGLPADRVFCNIQGVGNTSSSSIPLALADLNGTLQPGDRLGLTAFGGGMTFGAAIAEAVA